MHLVFHHFSQAPELATVVAKLLIRKGANLHAKNKAELGLLHCAVQMGNVQALKFAITHNKNLAKSKGRRGMVRDEDKFDFNSKGG